MIPFFPFLNSIALHLSHLLFASSCVFSSPYCAVCSFFFVLSFWNLVRPDL
jgi:hypothetical protein